MNDTPEPFPDTSKLWMAVADLETQRYTKKEIAQTLRLIANRVDPTPNRERMAAGYRKRHGMPLQPYTLGDPSDADTDEYDGEEDNEVFGER